MRATNQFHAPTFKPKSIIQPSSIARISLCEWCTPAFYEVHWGRRRVYNPNDIGQWNRFKTSGDAVEFATKYGFGGYHIDGKTYRLK
jgi:hypothetical protein